MVRKYIFTCSKDPKSSKHHMRILANLIEHERNNNLDLGSTYLRQSESQTQNIICRNPKPFPKSQTIAESKTYAKIPTFFLYLFTVYISLSK